MILFGHQLPRVRKRGLFWTAGDTKRRRMVFYRGRKHNHEHLTQHLGCIGTRINWTWESGSLYLSLETFWNEGTKGTFFLGDISYNSIHGMGRRRDGTRRIRGERHFFMRSKNQKHRVFLLFFISLSCHFSDWFFSFLVGLVWVEAYEGMQG